ncbi:MAG TPA: ABC transporter substrate-binding protein [Oceanobacillus sp.]|nr:ABC transporter substrate-binding protein [Oceanobacillus sp.]
MSKRSSLIALSTIFMLVTLVFSFSMISIQAQEEVEPTPTAIVEQLGTGDRHISFWNGLTGSDGVTLNAMLGDFVQENPDISVTTEIIPWNTLYTKLQTAFVAGTPPDVFLVHASEVPMFASFGVVQDLGSWYTSGGGWFPDDDVSEVTLNGMMWDGVLYGIPLDNHGRGLWINVGAFENAGVDPNMEQPTTYEGWVELFQQLTLDANGNNAASPDFDPENVAQWGFTVGEWPLVNFLSVLAQHGGSLISEDGTTITVNSEAGVTALQQFIDLVYTYNVSPPAAGFDTWQGFSAGAVAVLPTGTWFRNFAVDQTDIEWAAWPQLQFGDQPATWFGAHTFMVPANTQGDQLEAVQTLIRWVSEHQVDWAASGQVPARLSAQEALDPENYPTNILLGQTFTEYGILDAQHVALQELYAALDPELSAALNGQKSAQQALDDAASRMQQVLDRSM